MTQRRKDGTYFYEDANGTIHDVPLNEDIYMDIGLGIRMTGSQVDPQTGFNIPTPARMFWVLAKMTKIFPIIFITFWMTLKKQ